MLLYYNIIFQKTIALSSIYPFFEVSALRFFEKKLSKKLPLGGIKNKMLALTLWKTFTLLPTVGTDVLDGPQANVQTHGIHICPTKLRGNRLTPGGSWRAYARLREHAKVNYNCKLENL